MISTKKVEGKKMLTGQVRCMSFVSLSALATMLVMCPTILYAQATSEECKNTKVKFDGLTPLTYAVVNDDRRGALDIYKKYPPKCDSDNKTTCKATAHLTPGEVVTIGAHCGNLDYVQHIGDRQVVTGWVDDNTLRHRTTSSSVQPVAEDRGDTQTIFHFAMTKGRGTSVCEAYLQRLNQTRYEKPPYCDLPENTQVPGFTHLTRRWLEPSDIDQIDDDVQAFVVEGTLMVSHGKTKLPPGGYRPTIYRFDSPVDIENNGKPDNVLMWDLDNRNAPNCGEYVGSSPEPAPNGPIGVILSENGKKIDIEKTKRVFGNKEGGLWLVVGDGRQRVFQPRYVPIGTSYAIFEYRDKFYFSTYLYYDFGTNGSGTEYRGDALGVFMHQDGHTSQICEYKPEEKLD